VEWLLSPEDLLKAAPELAKPTHKDMQILVLGCGSSMLPTNLANAGWSRVHCIDASSALISTCAGEAVTATQTPASATHLTHPPAQVVSVHATSTSQL